MEQDKYFQNPDSPTNILCIVNCSDKEKLIAEYCGYKEIQPTFITATPPPK